MEQRKNSVGAVGVASSRSKNPQVRRLRRRIFWLAKRRSPSPNPGADTVIGRLHEAGEHLRLLTDSPSAATGAHASISSPNLDGSSQEQAELKEVHFSCQTRKDQDVCDPVLSGLSGVGMHSQGKSLMIRRLCATGLQGIPSLRLPISSPGEVAQGGENCVAQIMPCGTSSKRRGAR